MTSNYPRSNGRRQRPSRLATGPATGIERIGSAPATASPSGPPSRGRAGRDHDTDREPSKDRVRYLFPVPDATDWNVGELRYERKRSG